MISERKRIFIVVKTYPTISKEYSELVCTAGVLEDGSWIRLYPVPFRKLDFEKKYPKYTWVDMDVTRNTKDFRPETYRPDITTINVHKPTKKQKPDWDERRRIIVKNKEVYTNLDKLIKKAKSDGTSLAIFKPTKILDFVAEPTEREWNADNLEILKGLSQQMNLFQTPEEIEQEFKVMPKVPYKFSYKFEDSTGKKSTLMVEDWETGMLYFNCLKRAKGNEKEAISKVKEKYFTEFVKRDLHFFLGTTLKFHNVAPNPFVIIGTFHPPMPPQEKQISFFDK